jgi:hypothetical protein
VVGHLGAGRFAPCFRAGTFEARAAFARVRTALESSISTETASPAPRPASPSWTRTANQDLLAAALERLRTARVRHAYTGPIGPGSPSTTPLAG